MSLLIRQHWIVIERMQPEMPISSPTEKRKEKLLRLSNKGCHETQASHTDHRKQSARYRCIEVDLCNDPGSPRQLRVHFHSSIRECGHALDPIPVVDSCNRSADERDRKVMARDLLYSDAVHQRV